MAWKFIMCPKAIASQGAGMPAHVLLTVDSFNYSIQQLNSYTANVLRVYFS